MISLKVKKTQTSFHFLLLPAAIIVFIFGYIPIIGNIIAFQDFNPAKGFLSPNQEWIGLDNFKYLFTTPEIWRVIRNTIKIAVGKMALNFITPIIVALMLNEILVQWFKRTLQTMIYVTHFLSWVILGGILIEFLSPTTGMVNIVFKTLGLKPVYFLGNSNIFPWVIIITDVWKEFGYGTIIYLAAIASIDQNQYEAAIIDGAKKWQQTKYITIPGILPIIVLIGTLSIGNILNAGFEQIFTLYSPMVYETGDIIDTFTYRIGLLGGRFSLGSAVGLIRSMISSTMIAISYYLAFKFSNYRIF